MILAEEILILLPLKDLSNRTEKNKITSPGPKITLLLETEIPQEIILMKEEDQEIILAKEVILLEEIEKKREKRNPQTKSHHPMIIPGEEEKEEEVLDGTRGFHP
jgi:hypothetical protein